MLVPERFLSDAYIESRTASLLRRYFDRHPRRLPIDVERIADDLLDLNISWESLPRTADGAITLGGYRPDRHQLVLNEFALSHFAEFPGSENFTKAHEIGHAVLHVREEPAASPLFGDIAAAPAIVCISAERKPQREVQADIFASHLLMPGDLMRAECARRRLDHWPNLFDLARDLGVSVTALRIRLERLGLVAIDAEGNPRSL